MDITTISDAAERFTTTIMPVIGGLILNTRDYKAMEPHMTRDDRRFTRLLGYPTIPNEVLPEGTPLFVGKDQFRYSLGIIMGKGEVEE